MKSLAEQILCLQREIGLREQLYPGWVRKAKMHPDTAAHEIACMRAALDTLQEVQNARKLLHASDVSPEASATAITRLLSGRSILITDD